MSLAEREADEVAKSVPEPPGGHRGRDRGTFLVFLGVLGAFAVAAWVITIVVGGGVSSSSLVDGVVSGGLAGLAFFLAFWLVMMVAMMFPSAAPMVRAYLRITAPQGSSGGSWTPRAVVFVATYLAIWTATGSAVVLFYFLASPRLPSLASGAALGPLWAGGVLVAAGVYQFTPLKQVCLTGCENPFGFLLRHYRSGVSGAVRLGARHAAYCVGCCWLLFAILVAVGLMALPWMILIAALVAVEKSLPPTSGAWVSRVFGSGIAATGLTVAIVPAFAVWLLGS